MATKMQFRRDTAANWTSANPTLAAGEPAFETDTGKRKIGDGSTAWTSLPYHEATKITAPSSPALGDTIYYDGSAWAKVTGTKATGKVATIQADGSVAWATPGGGFSPIAAVAAAYVNQMKSWTNDFAGSFSGGSPAAGKQIAIALPWGIDATVSEITFILNATGTGATALANCFFGVANSSGTLLGKTADRTNDLNASGTTGVKRFGLTAEAGQSLTIPSTEKNIYWVGLIGTMSTTALQLSRGANSAGTVNPGQTAASPFRGQYHGTGLTALQSFTPTAASALDLGFVVGVN